MHLVTLIGTSDCYFSFELLIFVATTAYVQEQHAIIKFLFVATAEEELVELHARHPSSIFELF